MRHEAELPLLHALFDRLQEVARLELLDHEVGVARHPERVHLDDQRPGEERVEVRGDELLQRNERRGGGLSTPDGTGTY